MKTLLRTIVFFVGSVGLWPTEMSAQSIDCRSDVARRLAELRDSGFQIDNNLSYAGSAIWKRRELSVREIEFDAQLKAAETAHHDCYNKPMDLHTKVPALTTNVAIVEPKIPADENTKQHFNSFHRKYGTFLDGMSKACISIPCNR